MIIDERISMSLADKVDVWLDFLQEQSNDEEGIEYTRLVLEYGCSLVDIELDATLNYTYDYPNNLVCYGNSFTGLINYKIYGDSGCPSMYGLLYRQRDNSISRIRTKGNGYFYDN